MLLINLHYFLICAFSFSVWRPLVGCILLRQPLFYMKISFLIYAFFIYIHFSVRQLSVEKEMVVYLAAHYAISPQLPVATSISDTTVLLSPQYLGKTNLHFSLDSEVQVRSHALPEVIILVMKTGNGKSDESKTRREEQRRKYSKMDKRAKDKLVRLPRENGGG